ncbi:hypothetical protein Tco_0686996 [Tanacetum coccineum]
MFERARAFILGEVVVGLAEMASPPQWDKGNTRPVWSGRQDKAKNRNGPRKGQRNMGMYTPYSIRDTFTPLIKTPKEILAMEGISFPEPPPLIGTPEKQNLNKFCDYHGDRGHNTNDCYQLKKQIEEVVASGKLAHLRPYEGERSGLTEELTFSAIPRNSLTDEPIILEGMIEGHQCRASLIGFSSKTYHPLGVIDLWITMGKAGRSKIVLIEFAIVKCHSPYNVLIGRTRMRSLGAVGSTIHSMIKFSTDQGVVIMETSKEALMREQTILRARSNPGRRPDKAKVTWEKKGDSSTLVCHGTSVKSIPIGRTGGLQETTTNTREKTSIEGKSVQLAKGRDNQKSPAPRMDH